MPDAFKVKVFTLILCGLFQGLLVEAARAAGIPGICYQSRVKEIHIVGGPGRSRVENLSESRNSWLEALAVNEWLQNPLGGEIVNYVLLAPKRQSSGVVID